MNTIQKAFKHFLTITRHRHGVRRYCFRVGLVRQGLMHDMSKFSPTEFIMGVRYFQGTRSPNTAERAENGHSLAWMHHKGRNKHHFEYWTDYGPHVQEGYKPMEMPARYLVEMVIDRIAACQVYSGDTYTDSSALEYFERVEESRSMHPKTLDMLVKLLTMLSEEGEERMFAYMKNEVLGNRGGAEAAAPAGGFEPDASGREQELPPERAE